uniref:Gustatory receptor n=1 Tax=Strigamia maritima TaxID=126957 RepID=T1JN98_STRMM
MSMDSNEDSTTSTSKINRLWGYIYRCYGFQILGDYVTPAPKCCFACFAVIQVLINAIITASCVVGVIQDTSITNISLLSANLAYWLQSTRCLIVLYKKQNQYSHYLNELLQNITAEYRNHAWKLLLKVMTALSVLIIINVVELMVFDYTPFKNYNFYFTWKIIGIIYWFVLIFNETTKILFVFFCILLAFNFECLLSDVEKSMAFFSSLTDQKIHMLSYHYKYYRIIHWLNEVNKLFDSLLPVWIIGDIFYVCVSLRFLITNIDMLGFSVVFTIRIFGLLLAMYKYAAHVNEKAVATAIAITKLTDSQVNNYDPQVFNLSTSKRDVNNWSCHLFMHSLSFASVGINVSGCFILTRGSILTLVGTLLTYVVVVLQTVDSTSSVFNNTAKMNDTDTEL